MFNAHKNILGKYKSDDLFRKRSMNRQKNYSNEICLGIISPNDHFILIKSNY